MNRSDMNEVFERPRLVGEKRVKVKITEIGEVAVVLPGIQCWNVMTKIIFEDKNKKRYVKLYDPTTIESALQGLLKDCGCNDLSSLVGKDCVLIVEKMRDAVGDVWPKIKVIELGGEKCEHNA